MGKNETYSSSFIADIVMNSKKDFMICADKKRRANLLDHEPKDCSIDFFPARGGWSFCAAPWPVLEKCRVHLAGQRKNEGAGEHRPLLLTKEATFQCLIGFT